MPVVVSCSCGKRFEAKDSLAGQRVRCPSCGGILDIPLSHPPRPSTSAYDNRSQNATAYQPQYTAPSFGAPTAGGFHRQGAAQDDSPVMSTGMLVGIIAAGIGALVMLGIAILVTSFWSSWKNTQPTVANAAANSTASEPSSQSTSTTATPASAEPVTSATPEAPAMASTTANAAEPSDLASSEPPVVTAPEGWQVAANWQTYTSPTGNYSISMPARPEVTRSPMAGAGSGEMSVAALTDGKGNMFSVMQFDLTETPGVAPDFFLNSMGRALLSQGMTSSWEQREITVDGHPAREQTLTAISNGRFVVRRGRSIMVGWRFYQLMWSGAPESAASGDVEKFFDSFKVEVVSTPPFTGPVVVFEMQEFGGGGDAADAARQALTGIEWADTASLIVDEPAKEIVVAVRGTSVSTGPAKAALESAGFRIGSTLYKPSGR